MNTPNAITRGCYSHDLLIHDNDDDLVAGTVAFVEQGLESGGQVLVHSSEARVAMLRSALGTHPRLDYGLDCDLYLSPMTTLFHYERTLAQRGDDGEFWVTGTVPFGLDHAAHPAWTRYESLVNEVLGHYRRCAGHAPVHQQRGGPCRQPWLRGPRDLPDRPARRVAVPSGIAPGRERDAPRRPGPALGETSRHFTRCRSERRGPGHDPRLRDRRARSARQRALARLPSRRADGVGRD